MIRDIRVIMNIEYGVKKMKKVVLIDGNNILFRSYYATAYSGAIMKNSKGFPTNALYGFIQMINKILNEEKPEYVMIAFDKGKTFRHEKYQDYKGGRSETPNELLEQFPVAKQLVEAMGMTYIEIDRYEADDIIGTFAKKIDENEEFTGTIISSDKDLLQLISNEVDVKLLKQVGFVRMDVKEFRKTYGVDPIRMIDLKALMGDASDNIPGVKGIGEKTAIALLKEYDNIDYLYEHIDSIKGKLKEKLELGKESAYMSKDLATIYRDVPIDTDFEQIKYRGIDALKYISILEELEFFSLIKKIEIPPELLPKREENFSVDVLRTRKEVEDLDLSEPYAFYLEILGNNYHKDKKLGVGIYNEKIQVYIPFEVLIQVPNFFDNEIPKMTYDLKKSLVSFSYHRMEMKNCNYDAMIAAYLLNKNLREDISYLANTFGYAIPFYDEVFGTTKVNSRLKEPEMDIVAKLCIEKAKFIYETKEALEKELEKEDATMLFQKIEMPLTFVLADMEKTGIHVDKSFLEEMGQTLKNQIDTLEQEIYDLAGTSFNLNSPKQLGEILFVKLEIPYPKRVKDNNYSTSKDILDKVAPFYPIVSKILEYRMLTKLYTTYVLGLINEIHEDGKIHTIYMQTLTRTGRLSSVSPNLQNIPVREENGKLIRKAFLPSENAVLMSSDYSQIELRMFAHMSHAENLIRAFQEKRDIHTATAMEIFHVREDEVTKEMRRSAKAVNFGIIYGISSFGLSEDLGIDVGSAKRFIEDYLNTFPGIKEYMDEVIAKAHELGYTKTIMNRKRTIEELNNKNYMIRQQGERIALNTPIQGSSADILKKAMIELFEELKKRNLKSKMLLQVHDEIVLDVPKEEIEEVSLIVKDIMENTYKLDVPLEVDIETGINWYEAK